MERGGVAVKQEKDRWSERVFCPSTVQWLGIQEDTLLSTQFQICQTNQERNNVLPVKDHLCTVDTSHCDLGIFQGILSKMCVHKVL